MDFLSAISQRMNLWEPQPIHGLNKSVAPADVATLRKQLKVITAAGVIKEYKDMKPSPQAAKKTINKEVRFCLDYQHFVQRTLPDLYNDQNIERGLNCLIGNCYFTVLWLVSGICQLPTFPGEREKPYSVRPLGFYEYERMQPGYCETLARFQRMMENVLGDLNTVELLVYLDYIIIFGKTVDEHRIRLEKVCGRLQGEGLRVSIEGSLFFHRMVSYAGHNVFDIGITIDDGKKRVLSKWPTPRTISELQCYIDFCRYYQQFISGFQELAKPLNQILQDAADHKAKNPEGPWWTKESIEERWTKECGEAFYQLKSRLLKATILPRANMTPLETRHKETKKKMEGLVESKSQDTRG